MESNCAWYEALFVLHGNVMFKALLSKLDLITTSLDIVELGSKFVELLLGLVVFLEHLLVLLLELVPLLLKCLYLALEVSGLDIGLTEARKQSVIREELARLQRNLLVGEFPQLLLGSL